MLKSNRSLVHDPRPVGWMLLLVLMTAHSLRASAYEWKPIGDVGHFATVTVSVDSTSAIVIHAARIETARASVKVVSPYREVRLRHTGSAAYSLRETAVLLKPLALINGGFSASLSVPIPAGLLVADNQVVASLNAASRVQTGVFCVATGRVSILRVVDYQQASCSEAVQSGPVVVEKGGKIVVFRSETQQPRYDRSLVALDKKGRLLLLQTSKASLFHLATLLTKPESQGGFDVDVALNLSGDVESGLMVLAAGGGAVFGQADVPVASAIAVFPLRARRPRR